jgi:hypothetical protein
MSEQQDEEGLISEKGWIKVDFDKEIWIPCPPGFPEGMDRESWAAGYARIWWESSGLKHGERQIRALAEALSEIHLATYGHLPCHLALIHLRSPRDVPLLVCFGIWPAIGDRDTQIRAMSGADETRAMEPPIVEAFPTANLGDGLKALNYFRDKGTVMGALAYAWRSEEYETAVRLFTSCPDLGRLQGTFGDLDDLARVIQVVPRTQ